MTDHMVLSQQQPTGLRAFVRLVLRRRWIILVTAIAFLGASLAASLSQSKLYEAEAQVLLSRQNVAQTLGGAQPTLQGTDFTRVAQTQADLARSPELVARVLDDASETAITVPTLLENSTVSANADSDLIDFRVKAGAPGTADRLATIYAQNFIEYRRTLDTAAYRRARSELETRLQELRADPGGRQGLIASLSEKAQELRTLEALQTSNAFLVQEASPGEQIRPKPVRAAVLGTLLGFLLGIILAVVRDLFDTRIRDTEEIEEALGIPLLSRIPKSARDLGDRALVMRDAPSGVVAESYRMLRTNLSFVSMNQPVSSFVVTSAFPAEGKSTTSSNFALALARAGRDVLLIDLDLRKPTLSEIFRLAPGPGFTDVVIGEADLEEAAQVVETGLTAEDSSGHRPGRLRVLPAGRKPPSIGELIASDALAATLDAAKITGAIIVIDTPPVLHVPDASAISQRVDAVILVARLQYLRRPALRELGRTFNNMRTPVIGFVVTAAELEVGYGYGYGYSAGSDEPIASMSS